jgi:hypothetical protein
MKYFLLLAIMLGTISGKSQQKEQINVLFIGNSFTYCHDMPQTVQKMLNEKYSHIKIEQITFPGMSLSGHLTNIITSRTENGIYTRGKEEGEQTETEKKIAEKNWDIVILQTGTIAVLIPENRDLKVNKAISTLKKLVSNTECKFMLFYTWPSKTIYPEQYCYPSDAIDNAIEKEKCCSPIIENLEQEFQLITTSYDLVAKENDLIKAEIGAKYYEIRVNYPKIELYEDDSHPNENGAYLNACLFYQILTGEKASGLSFNGAIEPNTATLLKKIAE